jgi:hypothetical protein
MAFNGISELATKELRQKAKLDLAATKRAGTTQGGALVFSNPSQLSLSDSANLKLGNSTAFTIEFWIYTTAYPVGFNAVILQKGGLKSVNYATYQCTLSTGGKILFDTGTGAGGANTGGKSVASSTNLPLSQWNHIAVVWNSTNLVMYQNGVSVGTAAASPLEMGDNSSGVTIGNITGGTDYFVGSLSNIRIVKNVAVYTGAFTVPTIPLASTQTSGTNITAITGTATGLLLNSASSATYLTDSSSYAATVSNSNVTWSASGPSVTSTSVPYYRARATYDLTQLPTQYNNNAIINNPNAGGLVAGRPWIETVSTFTFYEAFGTTTAISTTQYVSGNKIYAESSTYDVPAYQPARVVVNDISVVNTELRGHTLVVLDSNGDVVTAATQYDTWDTGGAPGASTALASALSAVASGNIVVLVVYDASALTAGVRSAINTGYGSTNSNTWVSDRKSHIFIGEKI